MKIEQIYTGCLAQGAYYVRSGQEAVIIDPLREVEPYIKKATADGVKIKYVLETHFHADFVSGHLDLAAKTGATIVYGPTAKPKFEAHVATDGEVLTVGDVTIKVLHTPGHTMESATYLLRDENGKDKAIFTGDTLFLGDVGRPDLAQKATGLSQEELAGMLYDSLRLKIMPLADDIIVYPAHGAGSACGKNMSRETVDTLGHQKKTNYALRLSMTRVQFINEVTHGLLPPPAYFPENVRMNKEGYESLDKVLSRGLRSLTADAFEVMANEAGALILDTRRSTSFVAGFIPNSINIGLDGSFAPWVGALIPIDQPLMIICDPGREEEVATRLARVGYDKMLGYLEGGLSAWTNLGREVDTIQSVSASTFAKRFSKGSFKVIDVRRKSEFENGHVINAVNIPLEYLNQNLAEIPKTDELYIYCAGGYRSTIAASILKARGWTNIIDVRGGFTHIVKTNIPHTELVAG